MANLNKEGQQLLSFAGAFCDRFFRTFQFSAAQVGRKSTPVPDRRVSGCLRKWGQFDGLLLGFWMSRRCKLNLVCGKVNHLTFLTTYCVFEKRIENGLKIKGKTLKMVSHLLYEFVFRLANIWQRYWKPKSHDKRVSLPFNVSEDLGKDQKVNPSLCSPFSSTFCAFEKWFQNG